MTSLPNRTDQLLALLKQTAAARKQNNKNAEPQSFMHSMPHDYKQDLKIFTVAKHKKRPNFVTQFYRNTHETSEGYCTTITMPDKESYSMCGQYATVDESEQAAARAVIQIYKHPNTHGLTLRDIEDSNDNLF